MLAETKHTSLRLAAAVLLLLALLTACVSKSAQAQEKIELGRKYLTELNYTEAVASFTEAIQLDPDSIPAYMGRAEAYVGLEQYPEAKADYTTAIEKAADQPYTQAQAYVGRAEVNELTAASEDALSDYEAASNVLDKVDPEKDSSIAANLLEALREKIRAAIARLKALFGTAENANEKETAAELLTRQSVLEWINRERAEKKYAPVQLSTEGQEIADEIANAYHLYCTGKISEDEFGTQERNLMEEWLGETDEVWTITFGEYMSGASITEKAVIGIYENTYVVMYFSGSKSALFNR